MLAKAVSISIPRPPNGRIFEYDGLGSAYGLAAAMRNRFAR